MRTTLHFLVALFVSPLIARAGHDGDSTIWISEGTGPVDSSWVVQIPTGPSDMFSLSHDVIPGIGNSEDLVAGLSITGLGVSVADFGTNATYPLVGVFLPSAIDPSGCTPDLSHPVAAVHSPVLPPTSLFEFVPFELPENSIPAGTTLLVSAVQLPPGDNALLGLGADSTASATGCSAFTLDGFQTPGIVVSFLDFGLNPGQDNSSTSSCTQKDRLPHGRLRVATGADPGNGDHLTRTIQAGDTLTLAFFGLSKGDRLLLYCTPTLCQPVMPIGPPLNALPDADGDGSFVRVSAPFPFGYGGNTMFFTAVWGNIACPAPGAGFTNCVTVITEPDSVFGSCDDGSYESGWVVQVPSGPSDFFNNNFGDAPASVNFVTELCLGPMDFVTALPQYPQAGISTANLLVDPSGNTPDVSGPGALCVIAPFTFPAGTFATSSGALVCHPCPVPASLLTGDIHGWVQFPPGDPALLGLGGDTTEGNECSFFTLDGYTTPAIGFFVNWGIRLLTN